jgi:zona occludens toxin (predicted ATPase)
MKVEDLITYIILISTLIGALTTIYKFLKKAIEAGFKPVNAQIIGLDINYCRDFLVNFLADVENGVKMKDIQITRAYEAYDHYTKDLKGNSYIHQKWIELMEKGGEKDER